MHYIVKGHSAHCARLRKPSGYKGIIPRHLRASDKMWTTRPMAKRITPKIHVHLIHVLYHYVYITTNWKSLYWVMDGSSFSRQRPIQAWVSQWSLLGSTLLTFIHVLMTTLRVAISVHSDEASINALSSSIQLIHKFRKVTGHLEWSFQKWRIKININKSWISLFFIWLHYY